MNFKSLIAISTTAIVGERYPIWENSRILIGEAEFLKKEGDFFVFEVQLLGKKDIKDFDVHFSVDATTNELFALRAVRK